MNNMIIRIKFCINEACHCWELFSWDLNFEGLESMCFGFVKSISEVHVDLIMQMEKKSVTQLNYSGEDVWISS